jgi:hypothetical protein
LHDHAVAVHDYQKRVVSHGDHPHRLACPYPLR